MKKWIFAVIVIIILSFVGIWRWNDSVPKPPVSENKVLSTTKAPTVFPTPRVWKQSVVIDVDKIPIRISWVVVQSEDVKLYSNLKEQKLSEEIKVEENCSVLVNGGFYSEEKTHLGYFVSNYEIVSIFSQNSTLNGFLWIDANNKVVIGTDLPKFTPRWGLQTGPLLMLDNKPLVLSINNDEPKRRIVAGVTADDQLIFLAFYRDFEDSQGPLLGQLPEIINSFKKEAGINIVNAINLDGGRHSVFISNYDLLRESEIVGSYFCAR